VIASLLVGAFVTRLSDETLLLLTTHHTRLTHYVGCILCLTSLLLPPCGCSRRSFRHFSATPATYAVTNSNPECFQVAATVPAPAAPDWTGVEVSVDVTFEPESMGAVRGELRLSSPDAGTYTWPLYGAAVPPRPRGPFSIPKGGSLNIDLKNVLRDDAEFSVGTDNSAFSVAAPTVKVPGKKAVAVAVKYTPVEGQSAAGKLIVVCPAKPDLPPWVFYLSGQP
jgi:hypothetical protein